ncbi:hypothetical protein [Streptomyces chattanoogensis]|uniref:hypothetical protein n=1 Tax=Streptomyces chattanoogensis TaxID=66876 RepID=UPI0036BA8BB9
MTLCDKIVRKHPTLHDEETDGRRNLRQEQKMASEKRTAPHEGQAVAVAQNPQQVQPRTPR